MKPLRVLFSGALFALLFFAAPARAVLDVMEHGGQGDGLSDIWQLKYKIPAGAGNLDSDGDGASNANEAGAGTDPNSPADMIKVTGMQIAGGNVTLTWPSVLGKRYRLQQTTNLADPNSWTTVTNYANGTGADLSDSTPQVAGAFFRVAVYDMDTDGDGLTDWEERQLGLDPENARSHGAGNPPDLQWATAALQTTPAQQVVTIQALEDSISEYGGSTSFVVKRSAGIAELTVHFTVSGAATPDADYTALGTTVVIPFGATSAHLPLHALSDSVVESPEAVIVTLATDPAYTVGQPGTAGVIIQDFNSTPGTGLLAQFWNEGTLSDTVAPVFPGVPKLTRIDPTVDFSWPDGTSPSSPATTITHNNFSSRWSGEVLPDFGQLYTFSIDINRGGRLWVNGQLLINNWPPNALQSTILTGTPIALEAGKRYPIIFEQYDNAGAATARLRWQSANQVNPATGLVEAHVIPQSHLFPTVAPQILSPLEELIFVGGTPFSYQIVASATPTSYAAANLPPGLGVNTSTGLISGNPTLPGLWKVPISAMNTVGTGSAILEITVLQAGGGVVREKWTGLPGADVTTIPLGTPANSTSLLTTLQGPANDGDSYGVRIRGYLTAPSTGVYEFWLAADQAAELYISDDAEPVNAWKRASLLAPSSAPPDWSTAAKTPLLYLEAGSRYFFEIRQKEDTGPDFLAVGWSKPGEATTAPSEIIPGYLLTQYNAPAPVDGQSTLFITSLNAQAGAATNGYGSASLQLTADKTQAIVRFTNSNLTGPITQKHVHSGADGGLIMFDLDAQPPNADGSFTWNLGQVNGVADKDGDGDSDVNDVIKLIENGDAYLNLHTALFPAGEIKGFFHLATGSQTFVPPPAVADWSADPQNAASIRANAVRFLQQASFGATEQDISDVESMGYDGWITAQLSKPVSLHYPLAYAARNTTNPQGSTLTGDMTFNAWWRQSITAPDQLRQRLAFALSELFVVSDVGVLNDRADALSDFYDMLLAGHLDPSNVNNQVNPVTSPVPRVIPGITGYDGGATLKAGAFGNLRDILLSTTLHPAMGRYLDMVQNDKPSISTGRIPNENYAREILQLFSLGLYRLHPDGSLVLDSNGLPIPTYDQETVIGFAHVFTGWDYSYVGNYRTSLGAASNWLDPMREVPNHHYTGTKRLLNSVVIPGLATVNGLPLDPNATHTSSQYNDPTYQALATQELMASHDTIFNHPNFGPFVCRQLIQRLVTSTPSRGYIYRVVQKFNDNGSGVRGDMPTVIRAILLDSEARSKTAATTQGYGKQREPLLRVTQMARAFPVTNGFTGTWHQDGGAIFVNTTTPNRLSASQAVTLNFGDTTPASSLPLATSGTYANSTLGGTYTTTPTQFAVRTKDVIRSTYTQTGTVVTVTTQSSVAHGFSTGQQAYVRFRSGTLPSKLYPVTVTSTTVFTIDVGAGNSGTITQAQQCDVSFLRGGYTMSRPASGSTGLCTFTTTTLHGLTSGNNVYIDFVDDTTNYGSFSPVDGLFSVSVLSPTSFTVTATWPSAAPTQVTSLSNSINAAAESPVLDRGGFATTSPLFAGFPVTTGYQDFSMGSTDTDLQQSPLNSPTVFNFFLPDYQYPGELAQAGLITPEFQLASDTSVVRQANFLYNALFNPDNVTGLSSFKTGAGDIGLDISRWMDLRPGSTNPWTDNNPANTTDDNLRNLIRELSTLLMAGQMTAAMENEIYNYVSNNTTSGGNPNGNIAYTDGATTTYANATTTQLTNRRDRVRAIIHLIVTSPEYTIQK